MPPYVHQQVAAVQDFFADLYPVEEGQSIAPHLEQVAERMLIGLQAQEPACFTIASNWHPDYVGRPMNELKQVKWSLEDARITTAREHGFTSWAEVLQAPDYSGEFEAFIGLLLAGEVATLKSEIATSPYLLNARSNYGHRATPLHYLTANGTETRRQQVPAGLPTIIQLLLDAGADRHATMYVYGRNCTPYELFTSSAHPYDAGYGEAVANLLR